jgi:hypothetical protein
MDVMTDRGQDTFNNLFITVLYLLCNLLLEKKSCDKFFSHAIVMRNETISIRHQSKINQNSDKVI